MIPSHLQFIYLRKCNLLLNNLKNAFMCDSCKRAQANDVKTFLILLEVHLCFNLFLQLVLNTASSLPNFLFWIGRIEEILEMKSIQQNKCIAFFFLLLFPTELVEYFMHGSSYSAFHSWYLLTCLSSYATTNNSKKRVM